MKKQHINCLIRLMELDPSVYSELIDFLINERLLKKDELIETNITASRAVFLIGIFRELIKQDKVMLIDFSWTLLPVEHIALLIVANDVQKEFTYPR